MSENVKNPPAWCYFKDRCNTPNCHCWQRQDMWTPYPWPQDMEPKGVTRPRDER